MPNTVQEPMLTPASEGDLPNAPTEPNSTQHGVSQANTVADISAEGSRVVEGSPRCSIVPLSEVEFRELPDYLQQYLAFEVGASSLSIIRESRKDGLINDDRACKMLSTR